MIKYDYFSFKNVDLLFYCNLITTRSLHSIVVSIPDFHPGGRGSIPHGSKLVQLFIHFFQKNQTLRAKISPFPWEKSGNILISHSHEPKDRFKAIKFMVGHFGWEHFVCLAGIRSVKHAFLTKSHQNGGRFKLHQWPGVPSFIFGNRYSNPILVNKPL